MNVSKPHLAILAAITSNIIWGLGSPIFKWAINHGIGPFELTFGRFILVVIFLFPFVFKHLSIKREHWVKLFILSFFGMTTNIAFLMLGLQLTASINAPVISSSAPLFLIIGSFLFLHENMKKKVILGTLLSFLGVMVIILRPFLENGNSSAILGNIYLVISTLGLVMYTILLKEIAAHYKATTLVFWTFLFATISVLPFTIIELPHYPIAHVLWQGYAGALFGGIFSSTIAYICYSFALKQIRADEVGIFLYVDPVVTVLVAIPLLHEQVTFSFILGTFLVFIGIFAAEGRLNYHPFHKLKGFAKTALGVFIP